MTKPKHVYTIQEQKLIAFAHDGSSITVTQADPINGRSQNSIHLSKEEAKALVRSWAVAVPPPQQPEG